MTLLYSRPNLLERYGRRVCRLEHLCAQSFWFIRYARCLPIRQQEETTDCTSCDSTRLTNIRNIQRVRALVLRLWLDHLLGNMLRFYTTLHLAVRAICDVARDTRPASKSIAKAG